MEAVADSTNSATSDTPSAPIAFFRRSSKKKSSLRKRAATPPPAAASDSDQFDEYSSSDEAGEDKLSRPIKKRRKDKGAVTTENLTSKSSSSKEDPAPVYSATTSITSTNDATKQVDWHNENGDEYLARKRNPKDASADEIPGTSGIYKGASTYGSFIKKPENAPTRAAGPIKAPTNIRTITITDYAPDVCKDYKQTGFCGFGDTCKFLHAREDYAQGWKLDRDWEISQKAGGKAKAKQEDAEDDEQKELKNIPFACVICKKDYKSPIVTKCSHYFCESCAIGRYRKNPSCAICGKRTDGVFNVAKGLQKKLDRKREREEESKKKEAEENTQE
ncbi:RNA-splicing factor [Rhizina undulata]